MLSQVITKVKNQSRPLTPLFGLLSQVQSMDLSNINQSDIDVVLNIANALVQETHINKKVGNKQPKQITTRRYRIQRLTNTINSWKNSDEFIDDLLHLPEIVEKLKSILSIQAKKEAQQELVLKINNHYTSISPFLLKLHYSTTQVYESIRHLLSFERTQDSRSNPKNISFVPIILGMDTDITDTVVSHVNIMGGPSKVIWSKLLDQIKDEFGANEELKSHLFHSSSSNYLKWVFIRQTWIYQNLDKIKEAVQNPQVTFDEAFTSLLPHEKPEDLLFYRSNILPLIGISNGRRKRSTVITTKEGIQFPVLPTVEQAKKSLANLWIEKAPDKTDTELIECFEKGMEYIGQNELIKLGDKIKNIRVFDLRVTLLRILVKLNLQGVFKNHKSGTFTIYIADWIDGTTCLSSSMVVVMINLMYNKELFKEHVTLVREPHPLALVFCAETKVNVVQVIKHLSKMFQNIWKWKLSFKGSDFIFKLRISKADFSASSKAWGNSCGGHFRCTMCNCDFNSKTPMSYKKCIAKTLKSLQKIRENILRGKTNRTGIKEAPAILNDDLTTPLSDLGLDEYRKAGDALHGAKGLLYNLFKSFSNEKTPRFDEATAKKKLEESTHGTSFESLKGRQWRLFFADFMNNLIPCIKDTEEAKSILYPWSEVQFLIYHDFTSETKTQNVILRFYVQTFLVGFLILQRFPKLMNLYLHNIWIHWSINV